MVAALGMANLREVESSLLQPSTVHFCFYLLCIVYVYSMYFFFATVIGL